MRGEQKIGPDDQRFGAWARTLEKGGAAVFAPDADFARSLAGKGATLRVIYLDRGEGSFAVDAAGQKFRQPLGGSGRWKTAEFRLGGGALGEIRITAGEDLTLHMVEVAR